MKAALLEEYGQPLRVEEVPTPGPGAGEVLVRIASTGACHSDLEGMTAGRKASAVLDFVGVDATMATAAGCLGKQGVVVLVGLAGGQVPVSFMGRPPESTIKTSTWGNRNELAEVVALAEAGRITGEVEQAPLTAINEVFERLEHGDVAGRAVLNP